LDPTFLSPFIWLKRSSKYRREPIRFGKREFGNLAQEKGKIQLDKKSAFRGREPMRFGKRNEYILPIVNLKDGSPKLGKRSNRIYRKPIRFGKRPLDKKADQLQLNKKSILRGREPMRFGKR